MLVAEDLPDNGHYQWLIPVETLPTMDAYLRIMLTTSDETAQAQTAAAFTNLAAGRP